MLDDRCTVVLMLLMEGIFAFYVWRLLLGDVVAFVVGFLLWLFVLNIWCWNGIVRAFAMLHGR